MRESIQERERVCVCVGARAKKKMVRDLHVIHLASQVLVV